MSTFGKAPRPRRSRASVLVFDHRQDLTIRAESLKKLREMKDAGLITDQDFETKKTEILSRM